MRVLIIIILLMLHQPARPQSASPKDPTKKIKIFPKEYGEKRWKLVLGLDARRSLFAGNHIKINGLKIGAEFKGVHRFGIGFYQLKKNLIFTDIAVSAPDAKQPPEVRFDLGYVSLFYERILLKTRWWEIALPVHLGGGSIQGTYRDTVSAMKPLLKQPFSSLLLSTQVKFFPL